jgi:hypothetical protein
MPQGAAVARLAGRWPKAGAVAMALLLAVLLAACGSSSSNAASSSAQVKQEGCQQVEAVLSDGPEPDADPVGYAQAQILPLRQIHTSDGKLHQEIDTLASAYQGFSSSNGASWAKSAVSTASKAIDVICPGATS